MPGNIQDGKTVPCFKCPDCTFICLSSNQLCRHVFLTNHCLLTCGQPGMGGAMCTTKIVPWGFAPGIQKLFRKAIKERVIVSVQNPACPGCEAVETAERHFERTGHANMHKVLKKDAFRAFCTKAEADQILQLSQQHNAANSAGDGGPISRRQMLAAAVRLDRGAVITVAQVAAIVDHCSGAVLPAGSESDCDSNNSEADMAEAEGQARKEPTLLRLMRGLSTVHDDKTLKMERDLAHATPNITISCDAAFGEHSNKSFLCPDCMKLFPTWTQMTKHLDGVTSGTIVNHAECLCHCAQCNTVFKCYGPCQPHRHERSTASVSVEPSGSASLTSWHPSVSASGASPNGLSAGASGCSLPGRQALPPNLSHSGSPDVSMQMPQVLPPVASPTTTGGHRAITGVFRDKDDFAVAAAEAIRIELSQSVVNSLAPESGNLTVVTEVKMSKTVFACRQPRSEKTVVSTVSATGRPLPGPVHNGQWTCPSPGCALGFLKQLHVVAHMAADHGITIGDMDEGACLLCKECAFSTRDLAAMEEHLVEAAGHTQCDCALVAAGKEVEVGIRVDTHVLGSPALADRTTEAGAVPTETFVKIVQEMCVIAHDTVIQRSVKVIRDDAKDSQIAPPAAPAAPEPHRDSRNSQSRRSTGHNTPSGAHNHGHSQNRMPPPHYQHTILRAPPFHTPTAHLMCDPSSSLSSSMGNIGYHTPPLAQSVATPPLSSPSITPSMTTPPLGPMPTTPNFNGLYTVRGANGELLFVDPRNLVPLNGPPAPIAPPLLFQGPDFLLPHRHHHSPPGGFTSLPPPPPPLHQHQPPPPSPFSPPFGGFSMGFHLPQHFTPQDFAGREYTQTPNMSPH